MLQVSSSRSEKSRGGVSIEVWSRGSRTSGELTASGTAVTIGVAVCAKELGVVVAMFGKAVNDRGKLHGIEIGDSDGVVEADTGDSDRLLRLVGSCARVVDSAKPFYD